MFFSLNQGKIHLFRFLRGNFTDLFRFLSTKNSHLFRFQVVFGRTHHGVSLQVAVFRVGTREVLRRRHSLVKNNFLIFVIVILIFKQLWKRKEKKEKGKLRLVLSDETEELLAIEKDMVHPRNRMLDILDIVALFLIELLNKKYHRTKLVNKALAHIRQTTKNLKNP